MPETEALPELSDVSSSRTSIIDWNSSESDSAALSDYEFEVNVSNSLTNSSVTSSVSASVSSHDSSFVTSSYTMIPIPGLEAIKIPLDFNLKQLLIKVTETENLETVTTLRLRVIARDFSIQRIPTYLPNLRELNLNGSCLMTLRDLGCGMQSLKVLHVCRTGLNSLDGLFGLSGIIELYAANNNIKDVSPCSALNELKILNLANNVIKDSGTVSFLMLCTTLDHLTLEGNPTSSIENYRSIVKEFLPDLKSLDGLYYNEEDRSITRPLGNLILDETNSNKADPIKKINKLPPILPKVQQKDTPDLKSKRPFSTGSIDIRHKEKVRMLPLRPATARNATENDFSCIIEGSHLKLKDIRQLFIPSKLTCGKPLGGNPALGLWEKKKLQAWDEESN